MSQSRVELLELLEEKASRKKYNFIDSFFPDGGALRRELYKKHLEFFRAGFFHRERVFLAGNRVGKTESGGGYETALHLTGLYPDWWKGRRFTKPVKVLVAGDTTQTTRDIIQTKLLGPWDDMGCGLIRRDCIVSKTTKAGTAKAIDEAKIKHSSGGLSTIMFRSYDQGRKIFQGFELDVAWLDEEVPQDVYSEALVRTMTTDGMVILTFTPLNGLTPLVVDLLSESDIL